MTGPIVLREGAAGGRIKFPGREVATEPRLQLQNRNVAALTIAAPQTALTARMVNTENPFSNLQRPCGYHRAGSLEFDG